ncbi:putative methionine adenosyltransferase 2 subunit beta [Halenospora varia]|nr:putative methionine adenosyltransferase 2 subunit beta [Halenospora varia]
MNTMAKTALITGATGLLGRQVVKAFERAGWDVKGTGFTRAKPPTILKLDLGSEADVAKTLEEVKPAVVVHCAANRFPDKCDNDPEGTRALNIAASGSLAKLCAAQSIFLIYISTDYVFPGIEGDAPYEVTSTPSPPNLYGETKYEGEKAVLAEFTKAGKKGWGVILRVPVLYGEAESPEESAVNVLMNSLWKAQEKEAQIKMDHWAIRYPTNTEDVGRVCQDIAEKYNSTEDKATLPETLQFSSEDKFTKYEICELFAEIMGLPLDGMIANTEGNDPNASVKRPYDCHLSTKALKDIGINVATMNFKDWWRREARAYRK